MRRSLLISACLIGSIFGGIVGVMGGIALDSAWVAAFSATVFPVVGLLLARIRDPRLLTKIAAYALIAWGLCFVLGPSITQSRDSHLRRIAADPLAGKGWYIPCHIASGILAVAGVAFLPSTNLRGRESFSRQGQEANAPGCDREPA